MKKLVTIIMAVVLMISLAACGETKKPTEEISDSTEVTTENSTTEKSETEGNTTVENGKNISVLFFSVTGTTRNVAQKIAGTLGTDTMGIIPKEEYTSDDIDYSNDDCRANKEMKDESFRPEIKNDLSKVENSDTIYIGYPIWWGTAPRIIQTFFESYDLKGKTVYLFCTSSGSGIEQSVSDLQKLYPDVNIAAGKRFDGNVTDEEVNNWTNGVK